MVEPPNKTNVIVFTNLISQLGLKEWGIDYTYCVYFLPHSPKPWIMPLEGGILVIITTLNKPTKPKQT